METAHKAEITWTTYLAQEFSLCERRFYFHNNLSFMGENPDSEPDARNAYFLKHLQMGEEWANSLIRNAISGILNHAIKHQSWPSRSAIKERITATMRRQFTQSELRPLQAFRQGRGIGKIRDCTALLEHELGFQIPDEHWLKIYKQILRKIDRFYTSPRINMYRHKTELWRDIDKIEYFTVGDNKVTARIDFAIEDDDILYIFDWKLNLIGNKSDDYHRKIQALYAKRKWNKKPTQVKIVELDLSVNEEEIAKRQPPSISIELDSRAVSRAESDIKRNIKRIQRLLSQSPKDYKACSSRKICYTCRYQSLCKDIIKQ